MFQQVKLTKKQAEVFRACKWANIILYIGGYGSAKTATLCFWQLWLHSEYPGHTGMMCRQTYRELADTVREEFLKWCPKGFYTNFPKQENTCYLANGGKIFFRHILNWGEDLRGITAGSIGIDQAEEIEEEAFLYLLSRCRQDPAPRQVMLTANFNGHDWLYNLFRKDAEEITPPHLNEDGFIDVGGIYKKTISIEGREINLACIEAATMENPYLDQTFIDMMKATYPPEFVKRFVYCSWDDTSGLVFTEWDRELHIIPGDYPIPQGKLTSGLDHGISAPTAWQLANVFTLDDKPQFGDSIVVLGPEYYEGESTISQHVYNINSIRDAESGVPLKGLIPIYCDPSMFRQKMEFGGRQYSVAEEYIRAGLKTPRWGLRPARTNNTNDKINAFRELLHIDQEKTHIITGKPGAPSLYIREDCVSLAQEIENFKIKQLKIEAAKHASLTEDAFQKTATHAIDGVCYLSLSLPHPKRLRMPKKKVTWRPINPIMSKDISTKAMVG